MILFKPELADHLFDYLDVEKTGQLTLEKLIERLELIIESNNCDKIDILFKIFDHDGLYVYFDLKENKLSIRRLILGDGLIDFHEMKLLLRCFLEQTPSLDLEETLAELTTSLFNETDVDQSGDVSLDELINAFKRNEHLFKVLSLKYERM